MGGSIRGKDTLYVLALVTVRLFYYYIGRSISSTVPKLKKFGRPSWFTIAQL